MTAVQMWGLVCDYCSINTRSAIYPNRRTARRLARRDGWRYVAGRDYCPMHTDKAAA